MSIRFSDQVGNYSSAEYSSKLITEMEIFMDFQWIERLQNNFGRRNKSAVLQALSSGISNLSQTDSSFDISEWM